MSNACSRRNFVGGSLAAGIFVGDAHAAGQCTPFNMMGVQQCSVGIPLSPFARRSFSTRQEKTNWCWAACISNIFEWYERPVSQERVVEKIFGGDLDRPANGPQIYSAISGFWEDDEGDRFQAVANPLIDLQFNFNNPQTAAIVSRELLDDHPLIVGSGSHAMVVTALTWIQDGYGRQQIIDLTVRDPWPDSPLRRSLSAQEFYGIFLMMQIRVN